MECFSLSRYRALKPTPPFRLGGRYLRAGDLDFLADAHVRVALRGDFSECETGDQIAVHVSHIDDGVFECDRCEILTKSQRDPATSSVAHAEAFARFVSDVRRFFVQRGLSEIFTPSLVVCPGLEPSLEPFAVEVVKGRERHTVYLPTSPEIHLKKAMAFGLTDIF